MENRMRVLRAEKNITQEELAHALKVTRQTIIAIENEKYDPSLELAFKAAGYFGLKVDEMFTPGGKK
ncbi:MAG: helix-turn-helix transcriptional regulator [Spirochaetia bacterium]|nr:helix-turn-helix transcriptional regulator [Spirochaetia bacterium]